MLAAFSDVYDTAWEAKTIISLTSRCDNLVQSLKSHFEPTPSGHYFQVVSYPKILVLSFTWRFQKSRHLFEDLDRLQKEHEDTV